MALKRPKETSKEFQLSTAEQAILNRMNSTVRQLNDIMMQYMSVIAIEKWGFKEGDNVAFENIDLEKGVVKLKKQA